MTLYYMHRSAEQYKQLLEIICDEKTENVTIYSIFRNGRVSKELEKIVEMQKQVSQNRRIVFENHAVFLTRVRFSPKLREHLRRNDFHVELVPEEEVLQNPRKLIGCVKRLNRSKLPSKIWVRSGEARERHAAFESVGIPICFTEPVYDEQTVKWFDEWLYRPNAVGINTFTDIISTVLLHTKSPNCRYASCLGKTLFVDEMGKIYLCPSVRDESTYLGTQDDMENLRQTFSANTMYDVVRRCVERRSACANQCTGFSACRGGCPLEAPQMPECWHYVETVRHIHSVLLAIYKENKIDAVNSVVRNALLNAVAFNSAFRI